MSKRGRVQLSMMDFTKNKRNNLTTSEPPAKKSSPSSDKLMASSTKDVDGKWEAIGNSLFVYTANGVEGRQKIAGFDMDGTLVKTKSGKVFPKDTHDWQLWSPKIVAKIQQLHADGFKIVIFTNQRGIETGKVRVQDFRNKIINVTKALKVPIQAFISAGPVSYRKPYIGMWVKLEQDFNDGVKIDRKASIYVGDAAGRLKNSTGKADHSCADRSFALNVGVKFMTPEQMFLGQSNEEVYKISGFNPSTYFSMPRQRFIPESTKFPYDSPTQELIIMSGTPASGKSHISKFLAKEYGYEIVNQDILGTKNACQKMTQKYLDEGKNVIIDNTNRDSQTRESYIRAGKAKNCRIRALVMDCEMVMAQHNNTFREIIGSDEKHAGVNTMVLRMFFKAYQEPTYAEGFDDIIHCNFVPDFVDEKSKQIYNYILTEK